MTICQSYAQADIIDDNLSDTDMLNPALKEIQLQQYDKNNHNFEYRHSDFFDSYRFHVYIQWSRRAGWQHRNGRNQIHPRYIFTNRRNPDTLRT